MYSAAADNSDNSSISSLIETLWRCLRSISCSEQYVSLSQNGQTGSRSGLQNRKHIFGLHQPRNQFQFIWNKIDLDYAFYNFYKMQEFLVFVIVIAVAMTILLINGIYYMYHTFRLTRVQVI